MKSRSLILAAAALVASTLASATVSKELLGSVSSADQAMRTIVITPSTRYVNVNQGDVVTFISNGKSFTWNFDGPQLLAFSLSRVAPAGALDHDVTAYVARGFNSIYR